MTPQMCPASSCTRSRCNSVLPTLHAWVPTARASNAGDTPPRSENAAAISPSRQAAHVPPSRIAALARFANTVKVSAIAKLPDDRRLAALAAFVHSLEASAHDDALDVLGLMLSELFGNAKKADTKA